MDKVKIQEIAEEAGLSNAELLEKSKELGLPVVSAHSTISMEEAGILVDYAISGILPKGFRKPSEHPKIKVIKKKPEATSLFKEKVNTDQGKSDKTLKKENKMSNDNVLNEEALRTSKQKLEKFKDKLIEERDKLIEEKEEFKEDQKQKERELENELIKKEMDFNAKLEQQKIKVLSQLKDEFTKEIKNESQKIQKQLLNITTQELQLAQAQEKLKRSIELFTQEKDTFNSEQNKLRQDQEVQLKLEKKEYLNNLTEEKVKQLEEINTKFQTLFDAKEKELATKEEQLVKTENNLKIKEGRVDYRESEIEAKIANMDTLVRTKIDETIKSLVEKIDRLKTEIERLREENTDLEDELNSYERFEDKNIFQEIKDKDKEISELKVLQSDTQKKYSTLEKYKDQIMSDMEAKNTELLHENEKFRIDIEELERLESDNRILQEKLKEIDFIKGEKEILEKRLSAIYDTGKEKDLRVEDIKKDPYSHKKIDKSLDISDEIEYLDNIEKGMKDYGVTYPKRLLYAFHTAIKSADFSPLTVLSGVSGTGKSELPKLYSYFGGFNFLAEAVQPTWDSPEAMLGYYNTIENKFDASNILKFLLQTSQSKDQNPYGYKESMNLILLDEMNLAHIELYFAEFLSKFESRRGSNNVNLDIKLGAGMNYQLPLDKNVLWAGTMNEDETTKSLSDKVLDRSFLINFPRPKEVISRSILKTLDDDNFKYLHRNTWDKWVKKETLFKDNNKIFISDYKDIVNQINSYLTPSGKAIGHRVWQSMEFYISNHPQVINYIDKDEKKLNEAIKLSFEEQLVQKIMPKLKGIETVGKEKEVLKNIETILRDKNFKILEDFEIAMENPYGQFIWNSANYLRD